MTDKTASEPKWQQAWRAIVTAESDVALAMENAGICKQFKDRSQCPCSKLDATSDPLNELWDECARLAARVQEQEERIEEYKREWESCCEREQARFEKEKQQAAEIERLQRALIVLDRFQAAVTNDEPDCPTAEEMDEAMRTVAAARAAMEERRDD